MQKAILVAGLVVMAGVSGCRVHLDKDTNGEEKKVQVDTPFGGVHVNTNQTTATDLGLPSYPGATLYKEKGKDSGSADVNIGFGEWQLRVKAVSYSTPDGRDKVAAFYKQALGRYGDVITCQGHTPVGKPTVTAEGLSCEEDNKKGRVNIESGDIHIEHDFQLKAGSKRHQHIVGFEDGASGQTRFALVALDLPAAVDKGDSKRD